MDAGLNAAFGTATEAKPSLDHHGLPRKYYKININRGQSAGDPVYVDVTIQGHRIRIQRGVDVIVSSAVLHVLDNAVSDTTIQVEGGLVFQAAMRFPYVNKGEVSEEEYQAFSAKMRAAAAQKPAVA